MSAKTRNIRAPVLAGLFYPAQASELKLQVEDMLARTCDMEVGGEIQGLIAPHAGYAFSGRTAAAAYRQVRGKPYDTAVVMAPSHAEVCDGVSIFPGDGYETPLGVVPTDEEMVERVLAEDPSIKKSDAGHRAATSRSSGSGLQGEHAIEVQIPFLQIALPRGLRLLPIVMDTRSPKLCRRLADALVRASEGRRTLLVASSDLYHGYSYEACIDSDRRTLEQVESLDPGKFSTALENEEVQACGGGPIIALMEAARQMGASRARVVARTNSGDVTGGRGGYVVGYGAALLYETARRRVEDAGRGRMSEDPVLRTSGLRSDPSSAPARPDGPASGCCRRIARPSLSSRFGGRTRQRGNQGLRAARSGRTCDLPVGYQGRSARTPDTEGRSGPSRLTSFRHPHRHTAQTLKRPGPR